MEKYNYILTQYESMNKPTVIKTVPIAEVFQTIKNGDKNLSLIEKAREYGKGNANYDLIKTKMLLTYRFNFLIDKYALNKNIIAPTGLIYLDADAIDTIPESPYIFAKWKSLSNTGYGVLVKVENLTTINYKDTYNELSEVIGIKSDPGARKVIQQTVLSYDSNLYHNPYSLTYTYIKKEETKKVSFSNIKKEKKGISSNDTFLIHEDKAEYRNNNIDDYFKGEFADVPFLVFSDEKEKICQPFTPFNNIEEGQRNWRMFSYLSMYASLNPNCDKEYLMKMSIYMNNKMTPKLNKHEVNTIIRNVLKIRDEGSLKMHCNKERRILINPNMKFTRKEKYEIIGRENGIVRKEKKSLLIYNILESWDFEANGKIIQKKVAEKAGCAVGTMKRYWHIFKDFVSDLNTSYCLLEKPSHTQ